MKMEIGSIYEIDPGLLRDRGNGEDLPGFRLQEIEKYNKEHICYTASGREAIALALKSMETKHPDAAKRCLMPAYMCDTVFFPFERAGWELHFYHLNRKLEVDTEELERLVNQVRPGLIFIHPYYGVDTWKSARSFLHEWRAQGIRIMEDVTQSYYLESVGTEADYCVGSLRKWYAIPDGGFVAAREPLAEEALAQSGVFTAKRIELLTQKWEYLHGQGSPEQKKALKDDYLHKNRDMEGWLDAYAGISEISEEAVHILTGVNEEAARDRRRTNCAYLHERMRNRAQVIPVFGSEYESVAEVRGQEDPEGQSRPAAAPLYYPVYAKNRDKLQQFMAEKGVYAPTLWPVGVNDSNAASLWEDERYIYGHILALPIDQRYEIQEMQRILEVLDQYEEQETMSEPVNETEKRYSDTEGSLIGIRVDANETVATGHVMRCITIARQLTAMGKRVLFFTADTYGGELLAQAGMESVCLHTKWDHMEEETELLCTRLREAGCTRVLVDSYQVTAKYLAALRKVCPVIYIDDCFEEIYPVDMLINYNAYHVRFPYEEAYGGRTKLLLGTKYAPLREEFAGVELMGSEETGESEGGEEKLTEDSCGSRRDTVNVLLSSGGGDLYDALGGILESTVQDAAFDQVVFHVVVGGFNQNAAKLESLAARHPNIRLHHRVERMAELMKICTAAVSAAGTMLFELSAVQVPTVFFVTADNQQYDSEFFAAEERMLFAGDLRADRSGCLETVCRQLRLILEDEELRRRMRKRLHEVTDGKGAQRIADEMIRL